MTNLTIIIDSREQRPYKFSRPAEINTLTVGDYSIRGLENYVAIERKEVNDLIGCLTHDRERFERELYRARALDYFALVIESNLDDLARGDYRSAMNPRAAIQSLLTFSIRYHLPIFLAGSREYGQRITESLLEKYYRELQKRLEMTA